MTTYLTTDTDLTAVASAIRTKGGTSAALSWPTGFVSAVQAIPSGGGGGANTCTMTIGDDGEVTCSNFSDHTPSVPYIAVGSAETMMNPGDAFAWYTDGNCGFLFISDTAGMMGSVFDYGGGVSMFTGGEGIIDYTYGAMTTANYAGTYTATVIEV